MLDFVLLQMHYREDSLLKGNRFSLPKLVILAGMILSQLHLELRFRTLDPWFNHCVKTRL